jgi:RNA polymerase sigma-70 factor (ECF subfamily)
MPVSPAAEPDDAELMRRTATGDRDAFAAIYRRHQGTIFRFARLMTGSGAAAEDIVQEVFLAVMRDPRRYDARRASLSTYLYGIARRQTRRRLLRDRRFVALDMPGGRTEPAAPGGADADLARELEIRRLRRAILALPSRYREAIVLCDIQDVTYVEAAATLGCPVGTVRSRLSRARAMLMDRMKRADERSVPREAASPGSARMRCAV